jgi:TPR repeat protein
MREARDESPSAPSSEQTRIFLSYSRKDGVPARRIAKALTERRCDVLMDVEDIDVAEDWRVRLEDLIRRSDGVAFALSPSSLLSETCAWEVARAKELSKRLLPIVLEAVDVATVPAELSRLHWLNLANVDAAAFDAGMDALAQAAMVDIEWVREHTRLVELAARWDADARTESHLLRARAVDAASAWAARRGAHGPILPQVLLDFLDASREKEKSDRARLERSEHEARLKAADALFERAVAQIKSAEPYAACRNLLSALEAAPPNGVPESFTPRPGAEGWAHRALTLLSHTAATLPERIATYPWVIGSAYARERFEQLTWFDGGNRIAWVGREGVYLRELTRPDAAPERWQAGDGGACAVAGAARTPRLCALFPDGTVALRDVVSGKSASATFSNSSPVKDRLSRQPSTAVAISDLGDLVLVARRPSGSDRAVAELYEFDALGAEPRLSVRLPEKVDCPSWARFARGHGGFAVAGGGNLFIFTADGTLQAERPWDESSGGAVAPNLQAGVTGTFDLARLWRPRTDRLGHARDKVDDLEEVVLEGADGMIHQLFFLGDSGSVLAGAGRDGVLWTPDETLQRGLSLQGAVMTWGFGRSNRAKPRMRLDGFGAFRQMQPHPTGANEVLVASDSATEIWRFPQQEIRRLSPEQTGPSAVVAFDESGSLAAGSENGVWVLDTPIESADPRQVLAASSAVWDVDWADSNLLSTSGGRVTSTSIEFGDLFEDRAPLPRNATCLDAGDVHWIGTFEGEVWCWAPPNACQRWCATGLGRLKRIRANRQAGIGAAVGENQDAAIGGLAVFALATPALVWRCDTLHPHDVDISPDGRLILVGDQLSGALVIDAANGKLVTSIRPKQRDPSKPRGITAVRFCDDGCSAYIGLWDGTVALVDVWTGETLTQWHAHAKFVSDISLDCANGLIATASPARESVSVVVRRAWDADLLGGERMHPDWAAQLTARFEQRFGCGIPPETAAPSEKLSVERQDDGDPIDRARALLQADPERAADLFAFAWAQGHGERMTAPERAIAARTLVASGRAQAGDQAIAEVAAADPELEFQLGVQKVGARRRWNDWLEALPHFEAAARAGHARAALALADFYESEVRGLVGVVDWRGIAQPNDPVPVRRSEAEEKAVHWLEVAADRGVSLAAMRLSVLLTIEGNEKGARERVRQAARLGHPDAIAALKAGG